MRDFENFVKQHPVYESAIQKLFESSMLLALSAQVVYEIQGEALAPWLMKS